MRFRTLAFVGCLLAASTAITAFQRKPDQGPPVPFEDRGACPGEGCVYREWTAKVAVPVRAQRQANAPVRYTIGAGEKVTALTGVVVTVKAGQVKFRETRTLSSSSGRLRITPEDTLYLLTYEGEGFTKAWFQGAIYDDVDTSEFYNGVCRFDPTRCAGKIVEPSQTEWWVQVRNRQGMVGWTHEPEKFSGNCAICD
jgi:hypothetical protein